MIFLVMVPDGGGGGGGTSSAQIGLKKNRQYLKALTMKLSIFKNKRTSHPEISMKVIGQLGEWQQNDIELKVIISPL